MILCICGNKCDLYEREVVNLEKLSEFASNENIQICQSTSAKEDIGISEMFDKLAQRIYTNRETIVSISFRYQLMF